MVKYNLYYEGQKLNKKPLSKTEINDVYSRQVVYKKISSTEQKAIPTNQVSCYRCIVL